MGDGGAEGIYAMNVVDYEGGKEGGRGIYRFGFWFARYSFLAVSKFLCNFVRRTRICLPMTDSLLQDIKMRFGIIGNAAQLNRAIERAYMVAPTDYSVLVTGESGTGKEYFPKIVHAFSNRKHAQYIAINCGAIPNGTIDSELFGHVKGAFTGAIGDHKGYFEEADGGTVFLDEVGELPLETQVRLLRVLEQGEFIRVGSSQVRKTNVRVVAATNVNLQDAILRGRFREDLYYRLSTIHIEVPPLRERREDIPVLFRKFAADCTERYRMPALRLTDDAKLLLQNYYWRGNIRQLKNVAERICVLEQRRDITSAILRDYLPAAEQQKSVARYGTPTDTDYQTERELLYKVLFDMKRELDELKAFVHAGKWNTESVPNDNSSARPLVTYTAIPDSTPETADYQPAEVLTEEQDNTEATPLTMQELERENIRKALERNNGNRQLTARQLKMSERTLYRKIKAYNLS